MRQGSSSSIGLGVVFVALLVGGGALVAQTHYATGQNVVPVLEGWERNADGSFNMVFGYMNRNYDEELDIPVGPNNSLDPLPVDQGQPTHFYTRRQQFVFKVKVPKDWGKKDLVWTLTIRGKTEKAYASLLPFRELGNLVYQENRGGTGAITDEDEPNAPPTIVLKGSDHLTTTVGQPLTIAATVTDDGHPAPPAGRGQPAVARDSDGVPIPTAPPAARGQAAPAATTAQRESPLTQGLVRLERGVRLGVTWLVYRGTDSGTVKFDPMHVRVVNGEAMTKVQFARPGTYVLRGYADDTILLSAVDVTVTVR